MAALKEQKHVHDAFSISAEDRAECMDSIRKEQEFFDVRPLEEYKPKEIKPAFKERRSTQEETDSWTYGASEGDQEVMDTVYRLQENSGMCFIWTSCHHCSLCRMIAACKSV